MVSLGLGFYMTLLALIWGLIQGGTLSLMQVDLRLICDENDLVIQLDPVFLMRSERFSLRNGKAITGGCFFHVIFLSTWFFETLYPNLPSDSRFAVTFPYPSKEVLANQILLHEYIHARQFRATGPFFPFFMLATKWEGEPSLYTLATLDELNPTMWQPPLDWPDFGYFLRLQIPLPLRSAP